MPELNLPESVYQINYYYILAFENTRDAMTAHALSKEQIRALIMPVPSDISSGCGLALRFPDSTEEQIISFCQKLNFSCTLYKMSTVKIDGKRAVIKLFQKQSS